MSKLFLVFDQFLFFVAFITFIIVRFGELPSISQSWYELKKHNWLFTLFTIVVGGLMIAIAENGFTFFGGSSLIFVGVAGAFKKSLTKTVHYVFAVLAILFSFIGIVVMDTRLGLIGLCSYAVIIGLLKATRSKNYLWRIEVIAFLFINILTFIILWNRQSI